MELPVLSIINTKKLVNAPSVGSGRHAGRIITSFLKYLNQMRKRLRKFIIEIFPLGESEDGWMTPNPLAHLILKIFKL